MNNSKFSVLSTIGALIRKHKKKHVHPTRETLLNLLHKHHDVDIKIRMLAYHLADLKIEGYVKAIKQSHRNQDGTITLKPSSRCITPRGYWYLWKKGCEWAKTMYDSLIKKYYPKVVGNHKAEPVPQDGELHRLRALGKEIFKTEEYRKAFGLD